LKKTKSKTKTLTRGLDDPQKLVTPLNLVLCGVVVVVLIFNQYLISGLSGGLGLTKMSSDDDSKLKGVDLSKITSTAQSIQMLMPVDQIKDAQSAIDVMIPTGTPDYGQAMGISYDDPVNSMNVMVSHYRSIQLSAEQQQRYVALATKPVGISCEHCCGVGPIGITGDGKLRCGCAHMPALHGLTKWLMQNTDYSDAKVVQENLKWKTLFFPRNMVELSLKVAGGDPGVLKDLPAMQGGC